MKLVSYGFTCGSSTFFRSCSDRRSACGERIDAASDSLAAVHLRREPETRELLWSLLDIVRFYSGAVDVTRGQRVRLDAGRRNVTVPSCNAQC